MQGLGEAIRRAALNEAIGRAGVRGAEVCRSARRLDVQEIWARCCREVVGCACDCDCSSPTASRGGFLVERATMPSLSPDQTKAGGNPPHPPHFSFLFACGGRSLFFHFVIPAPFFPPTGKTAVLGNRRRMVLGRRELSDFGWRERGQRFQHLSGGGTRFGFRRGETTALLGRRRNSGFG